MTETGTDERLTALQSQADEHGFHRLIGYTLEAVGDGWARASVPHNEEFVNTQTEKVMHGGLTASVLDVIIGHAIMGALYADSDRSCGPTINLDINYVSTADEPLTARGEVHRIGKHHALGEGRIEGAETGKLIATGQGVWRVFTSEES